MKTHTIALIITILILIGVLIFYCNITSHDPSIPAPIPLHIENNVTTSSGIDFETGKPVLLSPLTGKEIKSCGGINIDTNTEGYGIKMEKKELMKHTKEAKQENQGCKTQVVNPTPELLNLINSTRSIINGTINKDNKDIRARFSIQITAQYEGSECETFYSDGVQYELCTSLEKKCSVFSTYNKRKRRRYNKKCSQFPFW